MLTYEMKQDVRFQGCYDLIPKNQNLPVITVWTGTDITERRKFNNGIEVLISPSRLSRDRALVEIAEACKVSIDDVHIPTWEVA